MIHHLSTLLGTSINNFINPSCFSLHYCSIDAAFKIVNTLGENALMGKIDLKNAFRHIPVCKEDCHLLGIHWQAKWFVDKCLPFGICSSSALFDHLATAIEWIIHNRYGITHLIHYLDDFFTVGPPESDTCKHNMSLCNIFVVVCCKVLILGVWGELACHEQGCRKRQGIGPANTPKQLINYSYFVLRMRRHPPAYMTINNQRQEYINNHLCKMRRQYVAIYSSSEFPKLTEAMFTTSNKLITNCINVELVYFLLIEVEQQ